MRMNPVRRNNAIFTAAIIASATVLVLVALTAALELSGLSSRIALAAMWRGAFGSSDAILSATLVRATPLVLAGLAVALAFRAGIWNIGAEGQLLAGAALASTVVLGAGAVVPALLVLPFAVLIGAMGGGAWAALAAALRTRFGVNEVISTIMLNFVALHLVGWLVRGPLQEPLGIYPQTATFPDLLRLPRFPGTRLHVGFLLAVGAAIAMWWTLRSTGAGFRIRAVGENPRAAAVAGRLNVSRTAAIALVVSGGIAGVAGAVEVTGVTFALYENLSPGYGFTAIAIALLARLHPLGVLLTGILFGALRSGALAMQREAGVPAVIVSLVEGLLILLVLLPMYWRGSPGLPDWRARRPAPEPERAA
jgi:general nucleoside transport system permease protein